MYYCLELGQRKKVGRRVGSPLIEGNREIRFETAPINGVHIICGAFIESCIHLSGRIDFDFGLDSIISNTPFMHMHI